MAALEKGTPPRSKQFLAEHAEIAADLAVCLDGLEMVHSAATKVRRRPSPRPLLGAANASQPLGDFQIVREIGRGGMGVVYEASNCRWVGGWRSRCCRSRRRSILRGSNDFATKPKPPHSFITPTSCRSIPSASIAACISMRCN